MRCVEIDRLAVIADPSAMGGGGVRPASAAAVGQKSMWEVIPSVLRPAGMWPSKEMSSNPCRFAERELWNIEPRAHRPHCALMLADWRYGCSGGPNTGAFTGASAPTISSIPKPPGLF
jgi:hypothetical protein